MELTSKANRHWQEFSSVSDFEDFITNDKFIQPDAPNRSGAHPCTDKYRTKGFDETIEKMKFGWPEGRDEIEKFVVDIEKQVMGYLPVVEVVKDVVGDWIDMGAFLAGEPENMASFQDTDYYQERRGGRIIHVVLNVDVSWEPFKRGACGVAIIDALERSGHRVVADAIANSTGKNGRLMETRIRVKNSDEPVQLDKLAFLFAHRDILGHCLFAAWERLPTPVRKLYGFDHGYGYVGEVPQEDRGDIYVPRTAGYFNSIEETIVQVLTVLKQNGVAISEEYHGFGG